MSFPATPAFLARQQSPVAQHKLWLAVQELREEAARLREEAAVRRRLGPDEGEGADAQAAAIEAVVLMVAGDPAAGGGPSHACEHPGCDADGGYGYGFVAGRGGRWACAAHRAAIETLVNEEREAAERRQAEALRPRGDMAGVGNRLI